MTDNKRDAGDDRSPGSDDFCQNSRIFGRRCPAAVERLAGRLRFRPMKPFLNLLREFGEIHLRNSRFSFKLNPIRFYAAHRRVFVYLAAYSFEVLRQVRVTRTGLPKLGFHNTSRGGILPVLLSARQCKNNKRW